MSAQNFWTSQCYVCVYVYVCVHVYVCVCMYVYMCTHTCIHNGNKKKMVSVLAISSRQQILKSKMNVNLSCRMFQIYFLTVDALMEFSVQDIY